MLRLAVMKWRKLQHDVRRGRWWRTDRGSAACGQCDLGAVMARGISLKQKRLSDSAVCARKAARARPYTDRDLIA